MERRHAPRRPAHGPGSQTTTEEKEEVIKGLIEGSESDSSSGSDSNVEASREAPVRPDPPTTSSPTVGFGAAAGAATATRLLQVLVTEGAALGTAAVALAYVTHVDPFGGFEWDMEDLRLGVLTFVPLMLIDSVLMFPDYSLPANQVKDTIRSLVKPKLLQRLEEALRPTQANGVPSEGLTLLDLKLGLVRLKLPELARPGPAVPSWEGWVRRARLALEMREERFVSRPTSADGLRGQPFEVLATLVTCLAEEMLYRAVLLTLVSLWIRDRMYEAGVDDVLTFGGWQLDILQAAQLGAVGVGAVCGVAAYALNAVARLSYLERTSTNLSKAVSEELTKRRRPAALPGWGPKPADGQAAMPLPRQGTSQGSLGQGSGAEGLDPALQEEVAVETQLALGRLDALVLAVEGVRDVVQVASSGLAFVATGNLAASYAGSVTAQLLFSMWRQRATGRRMQKRVDQMGLYEMRFKEAKQQQQHQQQQQQQQDDNPSDDER